MTPKTIKDYLKEKSNDYSCYEPFNDSSPISSSIIIPVYNRREILKKTLENISKNSQILNHPDFFELILVDDGSEEDILSTFKEVNFKFKSSFIHHKKNFGRSYARNSGAKKAKHELLFFLDADVLLPQNYFNSIWQIHNSVNQAVAVGFAQNKYYNTLLDMSIKPINIHPDITKDFRYFKKFDNSSELTGEFSLIKETNWFKEFGNYNKIGPWTLPKMVVTHNISVRKNNFFKVGGFDEQFKKWGYEDTHFGAKLIASECYVIPSKKTGVIRILEETDKKKFSNENEVLYENLINLPLLLNYN